MAHLIADGLDSLANTLGAILGSGESILLFDGVSEGLDGADHLHFDVPF